MQVLEFLRTIGCIRRDSVTVSLTESMVPRATCTLSEYETADMFRSFDERSVRLISPSSGIGGLFLVVEMFPAGESTKKEGLPKPPKAR